ncbi:hypothetical protein FACS1894125_5180 [Actinomycetota bacterium]|nr:hypothetical protein FACS1894125_5180 [Actinomycetota bacterium]
MTENKCMKTPFWLDIMMWGLGFFALGTMLYVNEYIAGNISVINFTIFLVYCTVVSIFCVASGLVGRKISQSILALVIIAISSVLFAAGTIIYRNDLKFTDCDVRDACYAYEVIKTNNITIFGLLILGVIGVFYGLITVLTRTILNYISRVEAKAKLDQRNEMVAYLHDSVLQTLATIQNFANDKEQVKKLARNQEQELRKWLYNPQVAADISLSTSLELMVQDLEKECNVQIEYVAVGDVNPDLLGSDKSEALILAAKQALLNAIKHGEPIFGVYLEVELLNDGLVLVKVFIKDNGEGFDVTKISSDHFGVKQSIISRVESTGGKVEITSSPDFGTEVTIEYRVKA